MKLSLSLLAATLAASTAQDATLLEVVASTPDLSTLSTAIGLADGLQEYLNSTSDLTFFAPNNAALESLPAKYLTPNFAMHLRSILEIHIVEGARTSESITDFAVLDAISGDTIIATVNDQGIFFSGDVFNNAQIVTPDILSSSGIIHMVNPYFLPAALAYDLYDLSTALPDFDQIRKLITTAGLEDELRAENRTILAPSDMAFDLLSGDLADQVANNPGFRDDLLLYHIVIGCYPSSFITDGLVVMTALGVTMNFTVVDENNGSKTYIAMGPLNNVGLQAGDLIASNGVAHALQGVLEVPVRSPPFVQQPSLAPASTPTEEENNSVPTSGEDDSSSSDAPSIVVVEPPREEVAPTQSSASPALSCVSWMMMLSSAVGFI